MEGRKIVFRAKLPPQTPSGSNRTSPSPVSGNKNPVGADLVFLLKQASTDIPEVYEISDYASERFTEIGQLKAKAVPEKLAKVDTLDYPQGEVYAAISEHRSAPTTPLSKTPSLDKKPEQEKDEFSSALDELLIMALELKSTTKDFLYERDSVALETKLQQYSALLERMEGFLENDLSKKEEQLVSTEMWNKIDEGVHPDVYLLQTSDEAVRQSVANVKRAAIINRFREIGKAIVP